MRKGAGHERHRERRQGETAGRRSASGQPGGVRLASCVLEVLAGLRSTTEAADSLGVNSLARYYQLEQRALAGLVQGCEPLRRGRAAVAGRESARAAAGERAAERECQRQQALVRLARQAAGLSPPAEPALASPGVKKRRRRETARGLRAAEQMRKARQAAEPEQEVRTAVIQLFYYFR